MSSTGQGSLKGSPRTRPQAAPGPPFVITSADNGLSVDPVTGHIVLGSDVGSPIPGQLLSSREIDMNGFDFFLSSGGGVVNPYLAVAPSLGTFILGNTLTTGDFLFIDAQNSRSLLFSAGSTGLSIDWPSSLYQMGDVDGNANSTTIAVNDLTGVITLGGNGATTAGPSGPGTNGLWKLGKFKAGAVALDVANFIEVEIDGVIRKVLVST